MYIVLPFQLENRPGILCTVKQIKLLREEGVPPLYVADSFGLANTQNLK